MHPALRLIGLLPVLYLLCYCGKSENTKMVELTSPNGQLTTKLTLGTEDKPYFEIYKLEKKVIEKSTLGLSVDGENLYSDLKLVDTSQPKVHKDVYTMHHGKQRKIEYEANEQYFLLENTAGTQLGIRFRLSDDGLAFRYELPGKSNKVKRVEKEYTSFAFLKESRAWLQEMSVAKTGWANVNPSYEEHYQIEIPVGTPSPSKAGWVFPALFKSGDTWMLISEAGINSNWHASRLLADSDSGIYKIGGPTKEEVISGGALMANGTRPLFSPWRLIAIGSLADVTESTLGTDVVEPAKFSPDKFNPGVAAWSWAILKDESVNYNTTKEFIDFAESMEWEYTLIDAEWDKRIGDQKIQELVAYADSKNVGLLLWYNSAGDWNLTEFTPKDKLIERNSRRQEFAKLQSWGIKGVKIDFFPGDGQSVMKYYIEILEDAADFNLLVNFHGSSLPRGLHRTYPNLMTMEAIKGFEFITFEQSNADKAAEHMTVLPFTRNVFDPMDFTPTTFGEIPNIQRQTTNGFEAALPVLFLSGIQHMAEIPENMAQQPAWLKKYIKSIPQIWDEMKLLSGEPGKDVVIARRSAGRWYIAGINGEEKHKTIVLDLSFVHADSGQLIADETPRKLINQPIDLSEQTPISTLPYGGFVLIIDEVKT